MSGTPLLSAGGQRPHNMAKRKAKEGTKAATGSLAIAEPASPQHALEFDPPACSLLLDIAQQSVARGVVARHAGPMDLDQYPEPVCRVLASFVSVYVGGRLRGCRGSLNATRPLVEDVWQNAYSSALKDSRFAPVEAADLEQLDIEISVLGPLEELHVASEEEFLSSIEPGVHGVLIRLGDLGATFLPKVWNGLPEKIEFLEQLRLKAGLPSDFWSPELTCFRYVAFDFGTRDK